MFLENVCTYMHVCTRVAIIVIISCNVHGLLLQLPALLLTESLEESHFGVPWIEKRSQ